MDKGLALLVAFVLIAFVGPALLFKDPPREP